MKLQNPLKLDLSHNRVFGLDILRFIAIFMVLLGHSMMFVPKDIKHDLSKYIQDGVSIFFVLSGFLIGGILIKQLNREKPSFSGLVDFWKRRWMRTLPAYLVVLIVLITYTAIVLPSNIPNDLYRFFFFIQNFFAVRPSFFAEAWSLSIEEWFYLSVPLILFVVLIFFKTSIKWTILIVSVIIIIAITYYRFYLFNYYHHYGFVYYGHSDIANKIIEKSFKSYMQVYIEYQVAPRLDSIMYGVLASFFAYYYPKFWQNKFLIIFAFIGIQLYIERQPIPRIDSVVFGVLAASLAFYYPKIKKYKSLLLYLFIGCYLLYYLKVNGFEPKYPKNSAGIFTLKSISIFLMLPLLSNLKSGPSFLVKPITYLSLTSYSMYLINLNIVGIGIIKNSIHGVYEGKYSPTEYWFWDYLMFWGITILLSVLMYKFIEIPFMRMRDSKKTSTSA